MKALLGELTLWDRLLIRFLIAASTIFIASSQLHVKICNKDYIKVVLPSMDKKQANKKTQAAKKNKMNLFILGGAAVLLILGFILLKPGSGKTNNAGAAAGELKMPKSEVTSTAKFYPYKAGNTYMEVLAVKASDGTIRTALNTCQVCYSSGRGYYKQQGNELVCQNCGNRFKLDQVEKIKGGCNPVPIMEENKIDDGTNIIIAGAFMEENKDYFRNWKK